MAPLRGEDFILQAVRDGYAAIAALSCIISFGRVNLPLLLLSTSLCLSLSPPPRASALSGAEPSRYAAPVVRSIAGIDRYFLPKAKPLGRSRACDVGGLASFSSQENR